jgi:hypothetical protein
MPPKPEESSGQDESSWVEQTMNKTQSDQRVQPWKKMFSSSEVVDSIDNTMEDTEDLIYVPGREPTPTGEATAYQSQTLAA